MKIELKPCPFCGGEAELYAGNECVWIGCRKCYVQTRPVSTSYDYVEEGKGSLRKAINLVEERWNRRVEDETD